MIINTIIMETIKFSNRWILYTIAAFAFVTGMVFYSCETEDDKLYTTSEGITIGEYILDHPDSLSEFNNVLERINYASFLKSYGRYTCFIPTNEAFTKYYQSIGKSSLNDFTTPEDTLLLKQIIAFHICPDSIGSSEFVNGGLPDTTMSGDYLTTSFQEGGINNIKVNDKATILQRDISCENGIIHIIDEVLDPIINTLAQELESNPKFSIYTQALKETGLYDSLNSLARPMTLFAISDSVFELNEIDTYNDLFLKFSSTGEPYLNNTDSLYIWMAYQCFDGIKFLTDLETGTYNNLTHGIIFSISKGVELKINKTLVDVNRSNNVAKNGVFHTLHSLLGFIPIPVAVYFEATDYPEIIADANYTVQGIDVAGDPAVHNTKYGYLDFVTGVTTSGNTRWEYRVRSEYSNKDYFQYWFDDANGYEWFELVTPELVPDAEYIVWACGKCVTNDRGAAKVYFDDEEIGYVDLGVQHSGDADSLLYTLGVKNYTDPASSQLCGFIIDTVYIAEKGTHRMKFVAWEPGNPDRQRSVFTLDMLHFIPLGDDQIEKKF